MDILDGKYKTVVFLILILWGFSIIPTFAQTDGELVGAFKTSYSLENKGEYAKAIEVLKKVYQSGSYEMNLRLGWLNYMTGLFLESQAFYQKAIHLHPMSIEARLGVVYPASGLGNWAVVMTQYEKILDIDKNNSLANYRMGLIYYGKKDYKTGLEYFSKVANLYPFDTDTTLMMGWTHFQMGNIRQAKIFFNKVLMGDPDNASAQEGLKLIK